MLLLTACSRAASLFKVSNDISVQHILVSNNYVYIMFFFPDMMYNLVYVILMWYYFTYYVYSHINIANDQDYFLKKGIQ